MHAIKLNTGYNNSFYGSKDCCYCLNDTNNNHKKDSTTKGRKYIINRGAYVTYGFVFPQLAGLAGFSDADAQLLKNSFATMFENDTSAARPSGSISSQLF